MLSDLRSGLAVFIVSIPLCLGVAAASHVPVQAGIISGAVGGILVGLLSGSPINVTGPSPALIAVVLSAVIDLKDYSVVLTAIFLSGIIQMFIGASQIARIGRYTPSSVINGFLCATGLILIFNQIPELVGYGVVSPGDLGFFKSSHGTNTIETIFKAITSAKPMPSIISAGSILLFVALGAAKKRNIISGFSYPLLIILFGVAMSAIFSHVIGHIIPVSPMPSNLFVGMPIGEQNLLEELRSLISVPSFAEIINTNVIYHAFVIAIASSAESALSVEAASKLDKQRRHVSLSREMFAQGAGNLVCGLIGGIPVAAAIIRTSVGVSAGTKSKRSTIISGFFLLASTTIPNVLNAIPLSALAAILVISGYRLVRNTDIKEIWKRGPRSYVPFTITLATIFFGTILEGICCGIIASLFFILMETKKSPFKSISEQYGLNEAIRVKLPQHVSFLHKINLIDLFQSLPSKSTVIIDAYDSRHIDHDILDTIKEFRDFYAPAKKIKVTLSGFLEKYGIQNSTFVTTMTKEHQRRMTPNQVLSCMIAGNKRFIKGENIYHSVVQQRQDTATAQYPVAIILSCMDSRSSPELIFDLGIGEAVTIRIAGNVVNEDIISSMQYACEVLKTKLIMVLGHTKCGAVTSACNEHTEEHPYSVLKQIRPIVAKVKDYFPEDRLPDEVIKMNAVNSANLIKENGAISKALKEEKIKIVSAVYNVATGVVDIIDDK